MICGFIRYVIGVSQWAVVLRLLIILSVFILGMFRPEAIDETLNVGNVEEYIKQM